MIAISVAIGIATSVGGYYLALYFDVAIAGTIASLIGFVFGVILLLAPQKGIVANVLRVRNQYLTFAQSVLLNHLFNHQNKPEIENNLLFIKEHLNLKVNFLQKVISKSLADNYIEIEDNILKITDKGKIYLQLLAA
jgi:manganese/zinc/iron transport system permease protein